MFSSTIIIDDSLEYGQIAPFDPSENYPENTGAILGQEKNTIYSAIRRAFINLGLNFENIQTQYWNPFSEIVKPGNVVIIKPNLVLNAQTEALQNSLTTHASVIRPIIDYCWKAMEGSGEIIIGDAPIAEADFELILKQTKISPMVEILQKRGINVRTSDFRSIKVIMKNGVWIDEQATSNKLKDSIIVNLGKQSMLFEAKNQNFQGGGYGKAITQKHHLGDVQEYKVSKEVLEADVVISVPKFKTHSKAGITSCLKNLVGINVDKNYLAHFTKGPENIGGDEFPRLTRFRVLLVKVTTFFRDLLLDKYWRFTGKLISRLLLVLQNIFQKRKNKKQNQGYTKTAAKWLMQNIAGVPVFQGSWQGNDTIWRMILDLNRIFLYAKSDGSFSNDPCRKVFYVVDAVTIGEENGPLNPKEIKRGVIAAGNNALNVDLALLNFFNINTESILLYRNAIENKVWLAPEGLSESIITTTNGELIDKCQNKSKNIQPPDNWHY